MEVHRHGQQVGERHPRTISDLRHGRAESAFGDEKGRVGPLGPDERGALAQTDTTVRGRDLVFGDLTNVS